MSEVELAAFRTQRLQKAIDLVSSGNKTDFGRKLGFKDGAFVRKMLAGTRPITEKTVRAVESLHGMKGWFELTASERDQSRLLEETTQPWPLKKSTPDHIYALTPAQAKQADVAFDTILRGFKAERGKI